MHDIDPRYPMNQMDYEYLLGRDWHCEDGRGTTLQEYARKSRISYESVRRQVALYKNVLVTHIRKEGKTQYLDDEAVKFLEEHRNPQAQFTTNKQLLEELSNICDGMSKNAADFCNIEQLRQLEHENGSLKTVNQRLEEELEKAQTHYKQLNQDYQTLREKYIREKAELEIQLKSASEQVDFWQGLAKIQAGRPRNNESDFAL